MRQAVNSNTSTISSGTSDFYSTSGTANAIILTSSNTATSLTNGLHVRFMAAYDNTGTTTVNLNNLGAKNVTIGGTNITAGKIKANKFYDLTYSSSTTSFELLEVETLPSQSGNSGKFLTTDGTAPSWDSPLPSQSGHTSAVLTTNGTTTSWSDLSTTVIPVITTYTDPDVPTRGYRIWADGYCEQWGKYGGGSSGITTITFLKTFKDTNYNSQVTIINNESAGIFASWIATRSTSSMTVREGFGGNGCSQNNGIYAFDWKASGYLAEGQY